MIRKLAPIGLALALASGTHAQAAVDISPQQQVGQPSAQSMVQAQDPGRAHLVDRTGLSGRGGPDPTGSGRTYSATIGSPISGTMSHPYNSRIGPRG